MRVMRRRGESRGMVGRGIWIGLLVREEGLREGGFGWFSKFT